MLLHGVYVFLGEQFARITFTGDFHNLKGHAGIQALLNQVGHNAVTGTDYLRDSAGFVVDQLLSIAQPYVGAMGKTGNLQEICEGLGLTFLKHTPYKGGTHLRQRKASGIAVDILLGDAQLFGAGKQADDPLIRHGDIHHIDPGQILEMFIQGWNIMPQIIQLEDGVMQRMEIKVGGHNAGIGGIRWMLHR